MSVRQKLERSMQWKEVAIATDLPFGAESWLPGEKQGVHGAGQWPSFLLNPDVYMAGKAAGRPVFA